MRQAVELAAMETRAAADACRLDAERVALEAKFAAALLAEADLAKHRFAAEQEILYIRVAAAIQAAARDAAQSVIVLTAELTPILATQMQELRNMGAELTRIGGWTPAGPPPIVQPGATDVEPGDPALPSLRQRGQHQRPHGPNG